MVGGTTRARPDRYRTTTVPIYAGAEKCVRAATAAAVTAAAATAAAAAGCFESMLGQVRGVGNAGSTRQRAVLAPVPGHFPKKTTPLRRARDRKFPYIFTFTLEHSPRATPSGYVTD